MKNQFNTIKEYVESGYFVLVKDNKDGQYLIFTHNNKDEIYSSQWYDSQKEIKNDPILFTNSPWDEYIISSYDLEIVELFRPNDLFQSKGFEVGDKVAVKLTNLDGGCGDQIKPLADIGDWVVEAVDDGLANLYYTISSEKTGRRAYLSWPHIYPRIEKQEEKKQEEKKPEDIIGEASKKALEDAGWTITKK